MGKAPILLQNSFLSDQCTSKYTSMLHKLSYVKSKFKVGAGRKKEALMFGEEQDLHALSSNRSKRHNKNKPKNRISQCLMRFSVILLYSQMTITLFNDFFVVVSTTSTFSPAALSYSSVTTGSTTFTPAENHVPISNSAVSTLLPLTFRQAQRHKDLEQSNYGFIELRRNEQCRVIDTEEIEIRSWGSVLSWVVELRRNDTNKFIEAGFFISTWP